MRAPLIALIASVVLAGPALAQATQARPACPGDVGQDAVREQAEYLSGSRTIRGLIYRPGHPNGAGVVLLHGARGLLSDAQTLDPHAIQLASRGYYVLVPNYYDALEPEPARSSHDLRIWRRAAADGVRWLATQPGADPSRMATWGYSLGGFLSGETAMESDAVAAGISLAGGTDAGAPGRDRRAVPLLLIHGRRDPVISPASTRGWAEGLTRRGATVEVKTLDWEGHAYDHLTWCGIFDTTREFLDRTVGRPV